MPARRSPSAGGWGDRVVVIAASTGAPVALAARDAGAPAEAYVFVSPNFRVRGAAAPLLDLGFADLWAPWVAGAEREWVALNAEHALYSTIRYPVRALLPMAAITRYGRRADLAAVTAPLLALFDDGDQVVDARATRRYLERWGGPVTVVNPPDLPGMDPNRHIIAGDIQSPGLTGWAVGAMQELARADSWRKVVEMQFSDTVSGICRAGMFDLCWLISRWAAVAARPAGRAPAIVTGMTWRIHRAPGQSPDAGSTMGCAVGAAWQDGASRREIGNCKEPEAWQTRW